MTMKRHVTGNFYTLSGQILANEKVVFSLLTANFVEKEEERHPQAGRGKSGRGRVRETPKIPEKGETDFHLTTDADGFVSVDLPVPPTGFWEYEVVIPSQNMFISTSIFL